MTTFEFGRAMLGFLFLFPVPVGSPQAQQVEHAPTVEQCRADQALWLSKLEIPYHRGTDDVVVSTLHQWQSEMHDCEAVDPPNQFKYYNTRVEALSEESLRELTFIYRHNLYHQFVEEDAAGKRGP